MPFGIQRWCHQHAVIALWIAKGKQQKKQRQREGLTPLMYPCVLSGMHFI
jgi:hypothetical protein